MAADQIETLKGLLERVRGGHDMDRVLDRDIHAELGFHMDQVVHDGTDRIPLWNAYTLSREAAEALARRAAPDLKLPAGNARAALSALLTAKLALLTQEERNG